MVEEAEVLGKMKSLQWDREVVMVWLIVHRDKVERSRPGGLDTVCYSQYSHQGALTGCYIEQYNHQVAL